MENKTKRFLSLVFALVMVFSMLPQITLNAWAADNVVQLAEFALGADGSAGSWADGGSELISKAYTEGSYTLSLTNGTKVYSGGRDYDGKGFIKFGSSSATGTIKFTVPADVVQVELQVAKYKAKTSKCTVNGTAYTLTKDNNSKNGVYEYDSIIVDTSETKTVTVATASGGVRMVMYAIIYYGSASAAECDHTYDEGVVTPPTCYKGGYTTYTCTKECGHSYTDDETPATGEHIPGAAATCTTAQICTNEGCGHVFAHPTGVHNYVDAKCSTCGGEGAEGTLVATFTFPDGEAIWEDGELIEASANNHHYTSGNYELTFTGIEKAYAGARDDSGKGIIKFGTSSVAGKLQFTVPENIDTVCLHVANYKSYVGKCTVNGSAHTTTKSSNNTVYDYDVIVVDTSETKTVTITTVSGGYRMVMYAIELYEAAAPECEHKYEFPCSTKCYLCGEGEREPEVTHEYVYDCSTKCNRCGEERDGVTHTYEFSCSTKCKVCHDTTRPDAKHTYTNGTCECGEQCKHNFVNGACDICGAEAASPKVALTGDLTNWNDLWMQGDSGTTVSCVIDLPAGTYHFKIKEDGAWMGNNSSFTDTATGLVMSSSAGDCTIDVSGGTYTFTYDFETNTLSVTKDASGDGALDSPKSDVPYAYTSATTIYGETWSNARESYVIKVLDAAGNVMGTSTLNPDLYTFSGDQGPTWHITLPGNADADAYWIQKWTITPTLDNMPAKVELWIDGVKTSESAIQLNGPDGINKIVAAIADADGKLTSYATTFAAALDAAKSGDTIELLADVTENAVITQNISINTGAFKVNGTVKVTNGATLTVAEGETLTVSDYLLVGNDNYFANLENAGNGGKLVVNGTVDAQQVNADNGGEITVNGIMRVINTVAVENGEMENAVPGKLTVSENGKIETKFLNVFAGATVTVDGAVELLEHETDQQQLRVFGGATVTVNGSLSSDRSASVDTGSTLNVNGGELTVGGTLTNNGAVTVSGESTLNIPTLSGTELKLLHGAIIKDSTVGGEAMLYGKVIFRGDNTFTMIYDYGNAHSEEYAEWIVEKGAALTLTEMARYGLGYGDKATIYGEIEDALTARENLTEDDISVFMHGLVAMSNWDVENSLTVKDSYVTIGSNNSFGNSPKASHVGTFNILFENAVLDASRITFYEAPSKTNFDFVNSDVKIGTFMTRDADSKFTLTNTKLLSTATTNGTDEGNYNAGELTLVNSSLTYNAPVTNTGKINLDATSTLTAPSITGEGTIIIDATGFPEGETIKIIEQTDANAATLKSDKLIIKNLPEGTTVSYDDGDVTLVRAKAVATIGDVRYYSLQKAIEAVADGGTITMIDNVTVTTAAYGQNALNHARAVNFTLDLGGYTLSADTGNSVFRFNISGSGATSDVTVTITNGTVVSGANTWCTLMASGIDGAKAVMNLENLTIENNKGGDLAVKAWANGLINAKNVTVNASYGGGFYALGGEIILDNCTVNQKGLWTRPYLSVAFGVSDGGKLTVNSGNYTTIPAAVADGYNQGTSHGSWTGAIMSSGGTLIINGGTFSNGNIDGTASNPRELFTVGADADYGDNVAADLQINGGTFNSIGALIHCETIWGSETDPSNTYMPTMAVTITDGDFTGVAGKTIGGNNPVDNNNPVDIEITGGTYGAGHAMYDSYLHEDYKLVDGTNGTYDVVERIYIAQIGDKKYEYMSDVLAEVKDGDTITLLADIEIDKTLTIGNINGAFDKINITINGNGKTIKAVGRNWNDGIWMVDVTWNVVLDNVIFDANDTGSKGVQFYTSKSTLNDVTVKNVSADKWGWADYAIHGNASDLTVTGTLKFVDCKHGRMILDIGSNTGIYTTTAADVKAATLENVTLKLNHTDATLTAGSDVVVEGSVAKIGDTHYPTLDKAFAVANADETITLTADVTIASQLLINKAITLDGNGYTITALPDADGGKYGEYDDYMIKVEADATVKNLVIDGGEAHVMGIQFYGCKGNIENVTVKNIGRYYPVMLNGAEVKLAGKLDLSGCVKEGYVVLVALDYGKTHTVKDLNTSLTMAEDAAIIDGSIYMVPGATNNAAANGGMLTATVNEGVEILTASGDHVIYDENGAAIGAVDVYVNTSNMTMGNDLDLNFWILKDDLKVGADYYAVLTRGTAKSDPIPMGDWIDIGDYYQIPYEGLSAKEMNDEISIQIFDANDVAASNVFTDSIVEYAKFMLEQSTTSDALKTALVDMLNYGAAAQKAFNHNKENLANRFLTAEQQSWASEGYAPLSDRWSGGNIGYGSNLELKQNIILHIWFKNAGITKAVVNYVHHDGSVVENKEITTFTNRIGDAIKSVAINDLVVADGRQTVRVDFYNGDVLVDTVTESIESYINYMTGKSSDTALYDAIMKFADSAKAYFATK